MKSIADLAQELGVTPAIIRSWQINLDLRHPRYEPEDPAYNADWSHYFQEVARLRKQGQSFSKIRASLNSIRPSSDDLPAAGSTVSTGGNGFSAYQPPVAEAPAEEDDLHFSFSSQDRPPYQPVAAQTPGLMQMPADSRLPSMQHLQRNMHEALLQQDLSKMAQTYVQLMENFQTLASRYSESAYIMGQLEEKNRSLEQLMHEKEQHFHDKDSQQQAQIKELENHIQTLKDNLQKQDSQVGDLQSALQRRETALEHQQEHLVTKEEVSQMEKQLKLLAVSIFKQQEQQEQEPVGFWQRFSRRLRKS